MAQNLNSAASRRADAALDELLHVLRSALQRGQLEDEERGFVAGMLRRSKQASWRPSAKELAWAHDIRAGLRAGQASLIEDEPELEPASYTRPPVPPLLSLDVEAEAWAATCTDGEALTYIGKLLKKLPIDERAAIAGQIIADLATRSPASIQHALKQAAAIIRDAVRAAP